MRGDTERPGSASAGEHGRKPHKRVDIWSVSAMPLSAYGLPDLTAQIIGIEWIVVLIVIAILLLFGPQKLPKLVLAQWRLYPDFVVLPQTTEEVSHVVRLSDETGLPITPRGGGTGMFGASVPNRGGVLIDLRKMSKVIAFDAENRTATVEAGATWAAVEGYLRSKGFALPVVPAAAPASTVGGAINGGGVGYGSFRHGPLRAHVLDLEVVLPDGSVMRTG